jgi:hypothetical protein
MCREALAGSPEDDGFAWGLITAQANQGHLDQAWSSFQQLSPPVTAPEQVPLWVALHARFGFTEPDITAAMDFIDRWPDGREVSTEILTVIMDLGGQQLPDGRPVLPELGPASLVRFQVLLRAYALRYPDGPFKMIDVGETDLVQVIRAQLVPHAGTLDGAADLVRSGKLPLGALAAAAARPYATMLVEQSCGIQYAVTADGETSAREISAARQALGREVVIETSSLAVVALFPDRWPVLRSAFASIRLPRPALVDIDAARSDLARAPGFSFSISYDSERDVLVRREISLAGHQRLHRRIIEIDRAARQLLITDLPTAPETPDPHQAWLTAIRLAEERHLPLWSDDVAVRAIAASRGIPVFATYALLTALREADLIPDTTQQDALTLARACVVDLPLSPDDLLDLARESGWMSGPATVIVSRSALWADYSAGLGAYLRIVEAVQGNMPATQPDWFRAACDGSTADLPLDDVPERLRSLTEAVTTCIGADGEMTRQLEAIAKQVEDVCAR